MLLLSIVVTLAGVSRAFMQKAPQQHMVVSCSVQSCVLHPGSGAVFPTSVCYWRVLEESWAGCHTANSALQWGWLADPRGGLHCTAAAAALSLCDKHCSCRPQPSYLFLLNCAEHSTRPRASMDHISSTGSSSDQQQAISSSTGTCAGPQACADQARYATLDEQGLDMTGYTGTALQLTSLWSAPVRHTCCTSAQLSSTGCS